MTTPRPPSALPGPTDVISRAALLLDLDGTLLDLAPRPDAVAPAPGLLDHLARLHAALGGALAVVTGRRLDDLDRILHPLVLPAAAEHGAALRPTPGQAARRAAVAAAPAAWRAAAEAFVAAHPGTLLEPKTAGFVLHYRLAPAHGPAARALMQGFAGAGQGFGLLRADHAWELRPEGIHKGIAVRALMAAPPFAGRLPLFIGDDVTDEDGIAAAEALGGQGFLVPDSFGSPAAVRTWLATLLEHAHAPAR